MICTTCGFDPAAWTDQDLRRTVPALQGWFRALREAAPTEEAAALRPLGAELTAMASLARSGALPLDAVVHRAWAILGDAGRIRHAHTPRQRGVLAQISSSAGGVPKVPVPAAALTMRGLTGDVQANRTFHGRPWQALCLWSADVIDGLRAQGHPVAYGSAGENLTIRGLDWSQIRPGLRMSVGTALLETTAYTIPCAKNAQWFTDGQFRRMGHDANPGTSRIYAKVLVEAMVRPGDPVVLEPMVVPVQRPPAARADRRVGR